MQDDTRTHVKCYKNLGDELGMEEFEIVENFDDRFLISDQHKDGVFSIGNEEHGKRYKSWANSLETASTELQVDFFFFL